MSFAFETLSWAAQIVELSDLDALVAEDVVSRGHVEEKIGQREIGDEFAADEVCFALGKFESDRSVFRAVEFFAGNASEIVDRLGNARLKLRKGGLRIGKTRRLHPREPRRRKLGDIAYDLDLPGKGKHVRREACIEKLGQRQVAGFGLRDSLVENF